MKIRVGIEGGRRALLNRAHALKAPILISANSLWDARRRCFSGWQCYRAHDVALDSGGFVAMKRYGGYRWPVPQYVQLARELRPTWWAQMDFCCEPELAADRAAVRHRIGLTVAHLQECQRIAAGENIPPPMPVLQGWKPEDYCHGPIYERAFQWPKLVGIGSVCRRHVHGPDGVLAVVEALDGRVPPGVQFHLFGVKSQAIAALLKHFRNRIASMDSMAWNRAASWLAYHQQIPNTSDMRAEVMAAWYQQQLTHLQTSV